MATLLKDQYRKQVVQACLEHLPKRFKRIPIYRAAEKLAKLGHDDEVFWWIGVTDRSKRYDWTIKELGASRVARWPAKSINGIEFVGGPPDRLKVHQGSVLTFLIDRILGHTLDKGMEALDEILAPDEFYT
jgi:hypothetical protein